MTRNKLIDLVADEIIEEMTTMPDALGDEPFEVFWGEVGESWDWEPPTEIYNPDSQEEEFIDLPPMTDTKFWWGVYWQMRKKRAHGYIPMLLSRKIRGY